MYNDITGSYYAAPIASWRTSTISFRYKGGGGMDMPKDPDPSPMPTEIDESVIRKGDAIKKKFYGQGRSSTILTGQLGNPDIGKTTLLGMTV